MMPYPVTVPITSVEGRKEKVEGRWRGIYARKNALMHAKQDGLVACGSDWLCCELV